MRVGPCFSILVTLATVSSTAARLVHVPFNDPRIKYDPSWVVPKGPALPTNAQAASAPPLPQNAQDVCTSLLATGRYGDAGSAFSQLAGASFEFQFVGTSASILTASGSGAPAYTVTMDGTTIRRLIPSVLASTDCRVTFESSQLPANRKTHTLRVVVDPSGDPIADAKMRVLGIVYNQTEEQAAADHLYGTTSTTTSRPAGLFVGVAIASFVGLLVILVPIIYFCWRKNRNSMYIDQEDGSTARRVLVFPRKPVGIISSTPTFMQHNNTKRYHANMRLLSDEFSASTPSEADTPSTTSLSGLTMLNAPTSPKKRPLLTQPPRAWSRDYLSVQLDPWQRQGLRSNTVSQTSRAPSTIARTSFSV